MHARTLSIARWGLGLWLPLLAVACASTDADLQKTAADPSEVGPALPPGSGVLREGFQPDALAPSAPAAGGGHEHHHHAGHAMPASSDPHAGHSMPAPSSDPHAGHATPKASSDPHAGQVMPAPPAASATTGAP